VWPIEQIIPQPNLITYTGSTMLATTLHGMALLLKMRKHWKWFINLSATDYPLATQDGEHTRKLIPEKGLACLEDSDAVCNLSKVARIC
jgi:hypothetical protein